MIIDESVVFGGRNISSSPTRQTATLKDYFNDYPFLALPLRIMWECEIRLNTYPIWFESGLSVFSLFFDIDRHWKGTFFKPPRVSDIIVLAVFSFSFSNLFLGDTVESSSLHF